MTGTFGWRRPRSTSSAERLRLACCAGCAGGLWGGLATGSDMVSLVEPYYLPMCQVCAAKSSPWIGRRAFLIAAGATAAGSALSQVDVGQSSRLRSLVPATELEQAAAQQYGELLQEAR